MRILFLTNDFYPKNPNSVLGGAETITYDLAKGLQRLGHEIHIITGTQDESLDDNIGDFENLKVYRIYSDYFSRWQNYRCLYNRSIPRVKKFIQEIKPDIIHAHNIHKCLPYWCLKEAKKYGKPVFLTVHDMCLVNYGKLMSKNGEYIYKTSVWDHIKQAQKRYNPFRNIVIKFLLKYTDKIFAVSNAHKKVLEINGIKNIETIYNGINVDDWKIDLAETKKFKEKYNLQNKKVILFGGRLSGAKGGDQALEAIDLIRKQIDNVVLLVMGERNKYVEDMKKLVKKLNIEQNVIFTGWLEGGELVAAYHSADVFVLPSLCFETFGMGNLEAMACRKPVVSSYFGGPSEVVEDQKTGYLVDPNNVESIVEKIIDLLKNPEKAKKFGEKGYQRIKQNFSLDKQLKETLKYYNKYLL